LSKKITQESADFVAQVEALRQSQVLCIGDLMLDTFVEGTVERISPEAPIPVLRIKNESVMPGGVGNVARNLSALGAGVHLISVVGNDEAGKKLRRLFNEVESVLPHLLEAKGRQTTIKTRYIAGGQQILRSDRESTSEVTYGLQDVIFSLAKEALNACGAVVLSDYQKGVLSPEVIKKIIALAGKSNKPVIIDPKGRDFSRYRGASLLTPNLNELATATNLPVGEDKEVAQAANKLMESCGIASVLATRGAEGLTIVRGAKGSQPEHFPAMAREVSDVSGAGDTVVATLAAALSVGHDLSAAAQLANVAAGIVVGKAGTAVVHSSELLGALRHKDLQPGEAKIVSLSDALERTSRWRRKKLKIGFTNGCFDLLHPGHISLLEQSRAACDRLVVGLNSDDSVVRLKGESRPVQSESARETVLASLACVDLVVVFSEDTPIKLIEVLRPDVLVKGADYDIEAVVGADIVQGYGGKVLLADLSPGYSTSSTIEKLSK